MGFGKITYSGVNSVIPTTTKGHVGDGTSRTVTGSGVVGNEVDTSNDTGKSTRATVVEHLYGVELGLLCNTI
jgi:hypothetical protein